jgi:hypothetical protein
MGYLPGYIATVTLDSVPINEDASDVSYSLTTDAIATQPLGLSDRKYRNGLKDATLSATLHMSTENAAALNAANAKTEPVAYLVRPGALTTHDVGQWTGTGIITDYSPTGSADGEWDVAITVQGTGVVTYTAPA